MGEPNDESHSFLVISYRYLRFAIVVVLASLMVSVLAETVASGWCWQESVSAYYFTPVHAVFIGALVTFGVSLVVLRGNTEVEDLLANVAGVLAAVVALVPTRAPSPSCASTVLPIGDALPSIKNNLLALAAGCVIAVVVAFVFWFRGLDRTEPGGRRQAVARVLDPKTVAGLAIGAVLLVTGIAWYAISPETFLAHAHGGGALVMFALLALVALVNAITTDQAAYRRAYAGVVAWMVLSFVGVIVVAPLLTNGWRHQILWLEILEIAALVVFWCAQTAEHWAGGVPSGADRAGRTDRLRSGVTAATGRR